MLGGVFSIRVLPDPCPDPDLDAYGEIVVGGHAERLGVVLSDNSLEATESAWRSELASLLGGRSAVGLRTQPKFAWVLYRVGNDVFVQEHLICDDWTGRLDSEGNILELPPRRTRTEEGERISEWRVKLADIRSFVAGEQ